MVSLAIEELPDVIKADVEDFLENHPRSPEVRRGASGLGGTPRDALKDFNQHFMEPLISRNGSEPHDTD